MNTERTRTFCKELAENLRRARGDAGLTQSTLAQKVGCTGTAICNYEAGRRMPDLMIMSSMSKALDVSIDDLTPDVPEVDVTMSQLNQMMIYDLLGE